MVVTEVNRDILRDLAGKYIWWRATEDVTGDPERVLAGTMNIGTLEDCSLILRVFGTDQLSQVITHAAPGWFQPKSWSFWHRVLGLIEPAGTPPPLPERSIP